jgi:hypothetical protein
MVEVLRVGRFPGSVTPDLDRRIERAKRLVETIAEMQADVSCPIPLDPTVTADKLGILRRLGVTPEQVRNGKESDKVAQGELQRIELLRAA